MKRILCWLMGRNLRRVRAGSEKANRPLRRGLDGRTIAPGYFPW